MESCFFPQGKKKISAKWVFKIQLDKVGYGKRYKARIVAGGHRQRPGVDFEETFASVSRYETLRGILAWAVHKGLHFAQFDAETAFLHGRLKEEIYMAIPPGVQVSSREEDALLLVKSLYGLRQAPRVWFELIVEFLLTLGFETSKADSSFFICHKYQSTIYMILVVDDGVIFSEKKVLS